MIERNIEINPIQRGIGGAFEFLAQLCPLNETGKKERIVHL